MSRKDFWIKHLEAIESEGIGTKSYADRHGLSVQELYGWRAKLKRNGCQAGASAQRGHFARVVTETAAADYGFSIEAGIASLKFRALPDPAWLGALLRVLQEA